jgi:hypothetical protein
MVLILAERLGAIYTDADRSRGLLKVCLSVYATLKYRKRASLYLLYFSQLYQRLGYIEFIGTMVRLWRDVPCPGCHRVLARQEARGPVLKDANLAFLGDVDIIFSIIA